MVFQEPMTSLKSLSQSWESNYRISILHTNVSKKQAKDEAIEFNEFS